MAHISAGVEYALHCLLFLVDADERGQPASARDLADLQEVPADFVAKLFTKLKKAGIVEAREGISGGFSLARAAEDITVLEVVEAIDGRKSLFECKGIRAQCPFFGERPPAWAIDGVCSVHEVMLNAEQQVRAELAIHTLASVAGRVAMKTPKHHRDRVREWLVARTPRRSRRAKSAS